MMNEYTFEQWTIIRSTWRELFQSYEEHLSWFWHQLIAIVTPSKLLLRLIRLFVVCFCVWVNFAVMWCSSSSWRWIWSHALTWVDTHINIMLNYPPPISLSIRSTWNRQDVSNVWQYSNESRNLILPLIPSHDYWYKWRSILSQIWYNGIFDCIIQYIPYHIRHRFS